MDLPDHPAVDQASTHFHISQQHAQAIRHFQSLYLDLPLILITSEHIDHRRVHAIQDEAEFL